MAFADVQGEAAPLLLLLAGNDDAASERWLARWEAGFASTQRVLLGAWDDPHPPTWLDRLNLAIQAADRPVVLVTHGFACLAVAWWVEFQRLEASDLVRAAVMHEPPVLSPPDADVRQEKLVTYPVISMPFPTCLLASKTRGYAELSSLRHLARRWNCHFDTMAEHLVPKPKSFKSVQSLGERFLAEVTSTRLAMQPAMAQAGYPFSPRER